MNLVRYSFVILALTLLFSSCGDDPKLVEKREKQRAEITRLKGELALIDEKLKNLPPDVSAELRDARQNSEKQNAEVAQLGKDVVALESKKRELQASFTAYQAKYQLK
jgi:predicted  nucleic acid-binding Zn-ribbon protein